MRPSHWIVSFSTGKGRDFLQNQRIFLMRTNRLLSAGSNFAPKNSLRLRYDPTLLATKLRKAAALFLLLRFVPSAVASEIWNGPSITFTKPSGADWMQPTNQDRITPDVWLTRNTTMGLFNAEQETIYQHYFSPADTAWAYGELSNYSSLTYTTWEAWNGHNPPSMVGKDAVLHLISEDIYLSIKFTFWGGRGGAFSYERSTSVIPEPSPTLIILLGVTFAIGLKINRGARFWSSRFLQVLRSNRSGSLKR